MSSFENITYLINKGVSFELVLEENPIHFFLSFDLLEKISRKAYASNKELELILFNPPKILIEQGIWEPISQGVAKRLLDAQSDVIFRMCLNASMSNPYWSIDVPLPLSIKDLR
jgi:hypothetical protein